jgi:hypothetical protein
MVSPEEAPRYGRPAGKSGFICRQGRPGGTGAGVRSWVAVSVAHGHLLPGADSHALHAGLAAMLVLQLI